VPWHATDGADLTFPRLNLTYDEPLSNIAFNFDFRRCNKEEAARAYDTDIRRRGWAKIKRLNFPDPAGDEGAVPAPADTVLCWRRVKTLCPPAWRISSRSGLTCIAHCKQRIGSIHLTSRENQEALNDKLIVRVIQVQLSSSFRYEVASGHVSITNLNSYRSSAHLEPNTVVLCVRGVHHVSARSCSSHNSLPRAHRLPLVPRHHDYFALNCADLVGGYCRHVAPDPRRVELPHAPVPSSSASHAKRPTQIPQRAVDRPWRPQLLHAAVPRPRASVAAHAPQQTPGDCRLTILCVELSLHGAGRSSGSSTENSVARTP
jgi:hypothetical protein